MFSRWVKRCNDSISKYTRWSRPRHLISAPAKMRTISPESMYFSKAFSRHRQTRLTEEAGKLQKATIPTEPRISCICVRNHAVKFSQMVIDTSYGMIVMILERSNSIHQSVYIYADFSDVRQTARPRNVAGRHTGTTLVAREASEMSLGDIEDPRRRWLELPKFLWETSRGSRRWLELRG